MSITMYSTNCPKCRVLEMKLKMKGIAHSVVTDVDKMVAKGMTSAPALEVDGKIDYDDSKTDIRALLRHIFHIAKENVVYLYYADLLDAIEAKAEAEESGMADKLKVYKGCYFLPLRKSA